jgi:hypothetical protein
MGNGSKKRYQPFITAGGSKIIFNTNISKNTNAGMNTNTSGSNEIKISGNVTASLDLQSKEEVRSPE